MAKQHGAAGMPKRTRASIVVKSAESGRMTALATKGTAKEKREAIRQALREAK